MNPVQLLQQKLGLKTDGVIGRLTFGQFRMHFDLTAIELAHFLGQCEHETGSFRLFEENLNYSKEGLLRVWPSRYDDVLALKHERKPSVIANHVYSGRMGNDQPNDGWAFRGRGCIQLTGRTNYTKFCNWQKDTDILCNPDVVSSKYAFESALWFFNANNIFKHSQDLSIESITKVSKAINIGNPFSKSMPHGLQDRINKTLNYSKFIT